MELINIFGFFFANYVSFSFNGLFNSSSIFIKIIEWFTFTCIFNANLPLVVSYMINHFLT
jgi:hypothetical protein